MPKAGLLAKDISNCLTNKTLLWGKLLICSRKNLFFLEMKQRIKDSYRDASQPGVKMLL